MNIMNALRGALYRFFNVKKYPFISLGDSATISRITSISL